MEQSSGFVRDFIRRIRDEIRLYSNYYAAIRTISTVLSQAVDAETVGDVTPSSSVDNVGSLLERNGHDNASSSNRSTINSEGQLGEKSSGLFADHATPAQNIGQCSQEAVKRGRTTEMFCFISRAQKYRLLLLRADAYSAIKQHEKALEDATAALNLSYNRSPEAYFIIGRELLRLFRVSESVEAFEEAELFLQLVLATNESFFEEVTDKNFWAQRGFHMADVEELGLDRSQFVQQEQAAYAELAARHGDAGGDEEKALSLSSSTFFLATQDEGLGWCNAQLLSWRQMAKEAKAFLAMRTSHVLPIGLLQTTLVLLNRRMSSVRNGVVVCVENTTSRAFGLVGCASPDAIYHANMHFPNTIPPGHCGLALLQPRGWGGFLSSVCYAVAENGVCCYFCLEVSFMGSINCGVRFTTEQRCVELAKNSTLSKNSTSDILTHSHLLSEFANVRMPDPSAWFPTHIVPLPCGLKLKALSATRGAARVVSFSVIEVLPIRLRAVELLAALEFAGPAVLKKMSAVSRRFRELINNFPPQMFYGSNCSFYPDYCLCSDRTSSPWIVHDKEPVMWHFFFDGHFVNRSNYMVTDSTNNRNGILFFSGESNGSVGTTVYYGDKRFPIAQIKCSWVPFSNTLYFCTLSGRTFASCFANRNSQLTLAWDAAGKKSKLEEIEYVMYRRDSLSYRGDSTSNHLPIKSSDEAGMGNTMSVSPFTKTAVTSSTAPPLAGSRDSLLETYVIVRPQRAGDGVRGTSAQAGGGMEVVAEFSICAQSTQKPLRGAKIGEILLHAGVDALLVTLMAYCRFQWEM